MDAVALYSNKDTIAQIKNEISERKCDDGPELGIFECYTQKNKM